MLLYFLLVELSFAENPVVFTSLGILKGFYSVRNSTSPKTEVFLNIPYAQSPIGGLRFEKPIESLPFGYREAKNWGASCIQSTDIPGLIESEDCLVLNILKPSRKPPPTGFPVLFWIHGGGFMESLVSEQSYERFLPYAEEDIIVVFPQYRVGIFGFLSDGSPQMKGNLGLWDLTMALKSVREHISSFGGNGEEITVWGYSAGGVAAGLLTLSPHSRDYVTRSIEMSGNAWPKWVEGAQVARHSGEFMKKLGCFDLPCLQSKPTRQLKDTLTSLNPVVFGFEFTKFSPRVDGDFLPTTADSLAEEADPKPVMRGFGDKDIAGLSKCLFPYKSVKSLAAMGAGRHLHNLGDPKELGKMNKEEFLHVVQILLDNATISVTPIDIYAFYSKTHGNNLHNIYTEFVGDVINYMPLVRSITKRKTKNWPVYLYSTDYHNKVIWENFNVSDEVKGAVHASEYPYLFDVFLMEYFPFDERDDKIRELWRTNIIQFAKTGKPLQNWRPTTDCMKYFSIRENGMSGRFRKEEAEFWRSR